MHLVETHVKFRILADPEPSTSKSVARNGNVIENNEPLME